MSVLNEITYTNREDTRKLIDEVVEEAYASICSTMGPNGNFVTILNGNKPKVTKDGVTVAKAMNFNEGRRNAIARLISEPSVKTDAEVGDGTTTTVFMMYHLYKAFSNRMTFANSRFIDMLVERTVKILNDMVIPGEIHSELFRNMLMTTSNYEEEIVDRILEVYRTYDSPNIVLEKQYSLPEDKMETNRSIYMRGSYGADIFTPRNDTGTTVIEPNTTRVFLINSNVSRMNADILLKLCEFQKGTLDGRVPVVIIGTNFDPNLTNIMAGLHNSGIRFLPYNLDAAGSLGANIFRDLGEFLKLPVLPEASSLEFADLGLCQVGFALCKDKIVFDHGDVHVKAVQESLVKELRARYATFDPMARQTPIGKNLFERISRLSGNNVIIKVTGTVPAEAEERYYRYEDAMKAAQSGSVYGILPGIGYGYLKASVTLFESLKEEDLNDSQLGLLHDFLDVLEATYIHLTEDKDYNRVTGVPKFLDLVTGEVEDIPTKVFDNAAATMTALRGGWATAKTLSKISNVMGSSIGSNIN